MKKIRLISGICIFCFFIISNSYSKTYYVSTGGNDGSNGLTQVTAWKTLAHCVTSVITGDSILLHKGDTFREKADFNAAKKLSLYIGSYGTSAAMPVVSGSVVISGWSLWKDNIYKAPSSLDIHYLYVNNKLMTIARYPNKGWLKIGTAVAVGGGTAFTATSGLNKAPYNTSGYWSGASMRWRRWSWWFETHPVTNSDASGKITVTTSTGSDNVAGWGFYLDNKLSELDTAGEWYYDRTAHQVYMYVPAGANVSDLLVEASVLNVGLAVDSSTVEGISFRHQTATGLGITGTMSVSNCRFEWIGSDGGGAAIDASWDVIDAKIHHNYFINNLNNTISWNENPSHGGSSVIEYNTIINSGMVPAYGGDGSWHASGIVIINANNLHIRYNKFSKIGYCGVIMGHDGNFVEYNTIKEAMSTLNDGGAIYCNCSHTGIIGNIIVNTIGNMESSGPWTNLGQGIWPEFLSQFHNQDIENNTVIGSGCFGLMLQNEFNCTIRNNTFYNNKKSQFDISGGSTTTAEGHVIENNIFFGIGQSQPSLSFQKGIDYGTIQNNFIGNPYNYNEVSLSYATEQWNKMFSWVKGGNWTDSIKIPMYRTYNQGAEMITDPTFDNGVSQFVPDAKSKPATVSSATDQPLLTSKCMKVAVGAGQTILNYNPLLTLTTGQFYEFKFDYVFQSLDVSTSTPWNSNLIVSIFDNNTHASIGYYVLPASQKRKNAWFVFYSPVASSNVRIQISHTSTIVNAFWIDNFTFKTADAQNRTPLNESQILYNDTTFARKIATGSGKWHDLYGKAIKDSVLLNPFASIILIRNEEDSIGGIPPAVIPVSNEVVHFSDHQITAYPNPVNTVLTLENLEVSGEIRIINANGEVQMIQKYYTDRIDINLESVPQGIYFIIVVSDNGDTGTAKILKL